MISCAEQAVGELLHRPYKQLAQREVCNKRLLRDLEVASLELKVFGRSLRLCESRLEQK